MDHPRWMRRCLEIARRAAGRTAPNPMVGAVVVKDGEMLAEGSHEALGRMHAEPMALAVLAAPPVGATMYVNLEPCCHWGRTPPCTDAILRSGIRTVVAGMVDPNPLVQGKGVVQLQKAGIEVIVGVEEALCRELNGGFIKAITMGLPRVSELWVDLDEGRPGAHQEVQELSVCMDTVIVDAESSLAWAALERAGARAAPHAVRALVGPGLPAEAPGEKVVRLPCDGGELAPRLLLEELCRRGAQNVLVWGNTSFAESLRAAGLVDGTLRVPAERQP